MLFFLIFAYCFIGAAVATWVLISAAHITLEAGNEIRLPVAILVWFVVVAIWPLAVIAHQAGKYVDAAATTR